MASQHRPAWTHYQVFESFGEDDEHERAEPFPTEAEAITYAVAEGFQYWLVYPCRQVQGPKGPWWFHASSYSTISW